MLDRNDGSDDVEKQGNGKDGGFLTTECTGQCNVKDDNVYINELRRVFNSCATVCPKNSLFSNNFNRITRFNEQNTSHTFELLLDVAGLERLCDELQLTNHRDYILGRFFSADNFNDQFSFDDFKVKFIQLLPEIIELSAPTRVDVATDVVERQKSPKNVAWRKADAVNKANLTNLGERKQNEGLVSQSDYDTGNDILSEFSDEGVVLGAAVNELLSNDNNQQQLVTKTMNCDVKESRPIHSSPYCSERKFSTLSNHSSTGNVNRSHALIASNLVNNNSSSNPTKFDNSSSFLSAEQIEQILLNLGLADRGYLVPYDLRILCQHLGLNGLSPQEMTLLFNQLDRDGDGKISVQDFVTVCPRAVSAVVAADEESCDLGGDINANGQLSRDAIGFEAKVIRGKLLKNGSFTLFSSLDHLKTGVAKVIDLIQYWKCIGVPSGQGVLKRLHFSENADAINLKLISELLLGKLSDKYDEDLIALAAFCSIVAEIMYLRDACDESREQVQHYVRELQQINQRNSLLVEELDQNQQNLEQKSQNQLKELEEKHQQKISSLESKYKNEREQWYNEIKDRDELLHQAQQSESSFQHRLRQLERENLKLKAEVEDLSQTVKELEDINGELRSALEAASSVRNKTFFDDDLSRVVSSGSLGNILQQHSGKSQVGLRGNKRRRKEGPVLTPQLLKRVFRKQKLLLEESSEFESEPECYSYYVKIKRPLKKRQRLALVAHRLQKNKGDYYDQSPSTSSNESSQCYNETRLSNRSPRTGECCSIINVHLTSLEQHLSDEFKFWTRRIRKDFKDLEESFSNEKRSMLNDFKTQLEQISFQHLESKRKALESLETDLRKQFDNEKRDLEIKWASERNIAERKFAEEKMQIMERLQHDFDVELRRIRENRSFYNSTHSDLIEANNMAKRKIEKLLDDQLKLQSHIKSLVGDLNFVRKKLTSEEKEKAKLKQYLEEMKRDLATISAKQKFHFDSTVDQLKRELCFFGDKVQKLTEENDLLKQKLIKPASTTQLTQTDHLITCYSDFCELKDESVVKLDEMLITPPAEAYLPLEHSSNLELSPKSEENNLFSFLDQSKVGIPALSSPTESACEAETFFGRFGAAQKSPDLSLVNICDKISRENLMLLAKLNEQEALIQDLTDQLKKQYEQMTRVSNIARKFSTNLQNFERNNYESVKIDAIKMALMDLYIALDKQLC